MLAKRLAGEAAAARVQSGMKVGLGTGSTVYYTLQKLGEMVRNGLDIEGIPTSRETEILARKWGIPLTNFDQCQRLDLTIDGADEVDPDFNLIKGGGGALFREKMVASITEELVIVIDESKYVDCLGAFPLPVEVVPFGIELTIKRVEAQGVKGVLRQKEGEIFCTDNGNFILDCHFGSIPEPGILQQQLKSQLGVVETGLFVNQARHIYLGKANGEVKMWSRDTWQKSDEI